MAQDDDWLEGAVVGSVSYPVPPGSVDRGPERWAISVAAGIVMLAIAAGAVAGRLW